MSEDNLTLGELYKLGRENTRHDLERGANMNPDRETILKVLEGLNVEVIAGPILKDKTEKPLTRRGAQDIMRALDEEGWKIVRE
jgi:hypothetical protein